MHSRLPKVRVDHPDQRHAVVRKSNPLTASSSVVSFGETTSTASAGTSSNQREKVIKACGLRPGLVVADIGAGNPYRD